MEHYAVVRNNYTTTGSSLDTNVWVNSNIFTSDVLASGVITRAVGATLLQELLSHLVYVVSGTGLVHNFNVVIPDISTENDITQKFSEAIISSRTDCCYEFYRVVSSKADPSYSHAFSTLLRLSSAPITIKNFAISYNPPLSARTLLVYSKQVTI